MRPRDDRGQHARQSAGLGAFCGIHVWPCAGFDLVRFALRLAAARRIGEHSNRSGLSLDARAASTGLAKLESGSHSHLCCRRTLLSSDRNVADVRGQSSDGAGRVGCRQFAGSRFHCRRCDRLAWRKPPAGKPVRFRGGGSSHLQRTRRIRTHALSWRAGPSDCPKRYNMLAFVAYPYLPSPHQICSSSLLKKLARAEGR